MIRRRFVLLFVIALMVVEGRTAVDAAEPVAPAKPWLAVELKVKETKFMLDLGGKTVDEFTTAVKGPRDGRPAPPAIEATLTLTNISDETFTIWYAPSEGEPFSLELSGPGAISAADFPPPNLAFKSLKLAPGGTLTYEAKSLKVGPITSCYWTKPGEYDLVGVAKVNISIDGRGFTGLNTVRSKPVKLTVAE